jgi:hypothetical protein
LVQLVVQFSEFFDCDFQNKSDHIYRARLYVSLYSRYLVMLFRAWPFGLGFQSVKRSSRRFPVMTAEEPVHVSRDGQSRTSDKARSVHRWPSHWE